MECYDQRPFRSGDDDGGSDDLSVTDEQDEFFNSIKGTSDSTGSGDGTDWWKQDPVAGEWRWLRNPEGVLEIDWQGDEAELITRAREISEAGGYGSRDPFKNAWTAFPSVEEILKAEQIRLSGGYQNWFDSLDQTPGYLSWVEVSRGGSPAGEALGSGPAGGSVSQAGAKRFTHDSCRRGATVAKAPTGPQDAVSGSSISDP